MNSLDTTYEIAEFTQPTTYTAARSVAQAVERHFLYHHGEIGIPSGDQLAPKPSAQIIEAIIDTTFWSSLRREEGRSPKISIAFLPPELAGQPLIFEQRLALSSAFSLSLPPLWSGRVFIWEFGTKATSYMYGGRPGLFRAFVLCWKL